LRQEARIDISREQTNPAANITVESRQPPAPQQGCCASRPVFVAPNVSSLVEYKKSRQQAQTNCHC